MEKEPKMKQVFIEFVIPDIVYDQYDGVIQEFTNNICALHGLTYDSFQVREFEVDEIPF